LKLKTPEIIAMIDSYDKDTRAIRHEALRASWGMRGGLSYEDAMLLSQAEREIVSSIMQENIDITKDTKLPYF